MCTVLLPLGVNPTAVSKYVIYHIMCHIISYHIISKFPCSGTKTVKYHDPYEGLRAQQLRSHISDLIWRFFKMNLLTKG